MLSENSKIIATVPLRFGYRVRAPSPLIDWCHFTPFVFAIEDVDGASKLVRLGRIVGLHDVVVGRLVFMMC